MSIIRLPNGVDIRDVIANLNSFSSDPTTSRGAGEIIYQSTAGEMKWNSQTTNPKTNPTWSLLGGGVWSDSGTLVTLDTAREVDFQGERVYLHKGASDAASTYLDIGGTGNLIVHIATGKAVEWQVG